jgi:hypothetical protein
VDVSVLYDCEQCVKFSIQDILNGLMNCIAQLQNLIMEAMNNLAKALGITFPKFVIPGLPTPDFLKGIDSFFNNLNSEIFGSLNAELVKLLSSFNGIAYPTCTPKTN